MLLGASGPPTAAGAREGHWQGGWGRADWAGMGLEASEADWAGMGENCSPPRARRFECRWLFHLRGFYLGCRFLDPHPGDSGARGTRMFLEGILFGTGLEEMEPKGSQSF